MFQQCVVFTQYVKEIIKHANPTSYNWIQKSLFLSPQLFLAYYSMFSQQSWSYTVNIFSFSGFGNAAGLLAQYGLMSGQSSTSTAYSDDSDSDTEEYRDLESQVNHVTGSCFTLQGC